MVSGYGVLEQFGELQGVHIDLVKHVLHVEEIDEVFRILKVSHNCGYPGRHFSRTNDPNPSFFIDHIMPQKELLGLVMNHPTCRSTPNTFWMDGHCQILIYRVQLMIGPPRFVRGVGNHP